MTAHELWALTACVMSLIGFGLGYVLGGAEERESDVGHD